MRPILLRIMLTTLAVIFVLTSGALAQHQVVRSESGGVTTVRNEGGSKYSGELFTYHHMLSLVQDPEIEQSLLIHPWEFSCDNNGRYYVADPRRDEVVVFDENGYYLHIIGRSGEGPGEFTSPISLDISSGIITVFDNGLKRSSRFDPLGNLIETITPRNVSGILKAIHKTEDGRLILISHSVGSGPGSESRSVIIEFRNDESVVVESEVVPITIMGMGAIPFAAKQVARCTSWGDVYVTTGLDPLIRVYDSYGNLNRIIQLDVPPIRITQSERQEARQRLRREAEQQRDPGTRGVMEQQANNLVFPTHKAYWSDMFIDDQGYIWLREPVFQGYAQRVEASKFMVVSPDGEYVGDTVIPPSIRADNTLRIQIIDGTLMAITRNTDTEEIAPTVYSIQSQVQGFEY